MTWPSIRRRRRKAVPPGISAEQTIDDVVGHLLATCQHHLLANQSIAERGLDSEGVHQMRVALRRLRTACTAPGSRNRLADTANFCRRGKMACPDARCSARLGCPGHRYFGRASQVLGSDLDFAGLRSAAEPHRIAAYTALREALASARYNRFHLSLSRWIACRGWRNELENRPLAVLLEPAAMLAGRVLTRLHRGALKRGEGFRHLQPEARHKLRIALKKLRYATEFFQGLYGRPADTRPI